jgi:hypothetical protein
VYWSVLFLTALGDAKAKTTKTKVYMSISQTHYVILGIKYDFDEAKRNLGDEVFDNDIVNNYEDDVYEEKITEKNGLTVVSDGMNGEYFVIGKVLVKASLVDGIEMTSIPIQHSGQVTEQTRKIMRDIEKCFPQLNPDPLDVKIYIFTHWH